VNCLHSVADAMRKIYAAEGIKGLWRSTVPSAVLAINPAVQFMVYEALKRKLQTSFHSQVVLTCPSNEIGLRWILYF